MQVGTARFGHLESPLTPAPRYLAPFLSVRPHPVYHSLADHKGTGTPSVRLMIQPTTLRITTPTISVARPAVPRPKLLTTCEDRECAKELHLVFVCLPALRPASRCRCLTLPSLLPLK